ncbi:phospholipase A2 inhibitor and Ly6/PLAUR domain-containing protein-like [Eublepharis macularius]|uniref:Phospholipase A2 inhibitor and Ly6/PLAUR domain-containing protein-like n=1 Tax=Eublepharis macularius TaxID=481883 RepID=A0AA97KFU8_EUBMA|nr:phospholipase A2 inhibitor and Ly6/PLAUR domain-containing protein-like [Eublepharis macularius]
MRVLVSTCLLLTLLPPAASLDCLQCLTPQCDKTTSFLCDGEDSANEDKVCFSKVMDFPLNGSNRLETKYISLGCIRRQDCHPATYSASLEHSGYIYTQVQCCDTNLCNLPISVEDLTNYEFNEMQCPGCFAGWPTGKHLCSAQGTVNCRGHENRCIEFTGRFNTPLYFYPTISFRGCATESMCALATGDPEAATDLLKPVKANARCSPA